MNELAIFAGVGGGILGTNIIGWRTVCAVEKDPYAASILIQRQNDGLLPPFPIWDDVRTFDGSPFKGIIDVVSGGFPCQAFSTAARGKNNAEDLWPEMRRIVKDVAPRFVWIENVSRRAIDAAGDDLEKMGYETEAISLGAIDLGGDHVRRRYWLLAYADDKSKLLCGLNAQMALGTFIRHGVWKTPPYQSGMADGVASWVDRFRAIGNGQIPIVEIAALAAICSNNKIT